MAGAIGVAAILTARYLRITCPHCGHVKRAERKLVAYRVCPKCRRQFADPTQRKR
jgi:ribosomal protein L37AE/L43A